MEHFNTKDWTFEDQQIRDETLRAYCRIHKVKLLEIKYDEVDRIPKILAKAIEKFRKTTIILLENWAGTLLPCPVFFLGIPRNIGYKESGSAVGTY